MSYLENIKINATHYYELIKELSLKEWLFLAPLILVILVLLVFIRSYIREQEDKKRFAVVQSKDNWKKSFVQLIENNKQLNNLGTYFGNRVAMLNDRSMEKNKEYGAIIVIGIIVLACISTICVFFYTTLWYMVLFYLITEFAFIFLILYFFTFSAKVSLLKECPKAYRLIGTNLKRYNNLSVVLSETMQRLDGPLGREFRRMHQLLRKNDQQEIEEVVSIIESNYSSNYFSLLLMLILHVHKKGNASEAAKSFETIKEELLTEIEHKKNLAQTSRMYVSAMVLIGFVSIPGSEIFMRQILGADVANAYITSVDGNIYKLGIFFLIIIATVVMMAIEKGAE